jgi:hypothetical protein
VRRQCRRFALYWERPCDQWGKRKAGMVRRTWILLSVLRRNHCGMGLIARAESQQGVCDKETTRTDRFWRCALASFCLMRNVFCEG